MCRRSRREVLGAGIAGFAFAGIGPVRGNAQTAGAVPEALRKRFIAEAERMRHLAVRAGDQSYGAVVVQGAEIVGFGPSRVISDRNVNAHAERVAIWDAQKRLGANDLSGAVLYSTSRACAACETAAAAARIARMFWGPHGIDAGVPRG